MAQAEGTAQLGRITDDYSGGLRASTELSIDVLEGDNVLNIVARGEDGDPVAVTITAPDGTRAVYDLTNAAGELTTDTVPVTLPSGGVEPLRIDVQPGRYTVVFDTDVEPFDITLTPDDSTVYDTTEVPLGGGRLSSRDWRFFGDLPGGSTVVPMNADFYVRATVGDDFEFVWELDFEGLLGGQMCLTANNLGLPGEFARSSQPFSALDGVNGFNAAAASASNASEETRFALCDDLSQYDIYLNVPHSRKPEPDAPEIEDVGIGACGAIIEGMGGVISFDASLQGTYLVVIDVNKDGTFDPKTGDVAIDGSAVQGSNSVVWDGLDNASNPVAAGEDYAARVFLRLGEFHFTGADIEVVNPGIGVNRIVPNAANDTSDKVSARLSWDDEALAANGFNNATVAPDPVWSTPDGAAPGVRHAWAGTAISGTSYRGPGENAFIDTWVFGVESVADIQFNILDPAADLDGDGLVNGRECEIGSLVSEIDSDGDGVGDYEEEPSNVLGDAPRDTDGDGIPDALDPDDDGDGVPTKDEGALPNGGGRDTDNDGTPDYLDPDDDGDGVPTAIENPDPDADGDVDDARDTDGDGVPDYLDADDDGDGIDTKNEGPSDTDPNDARDTDGDGIPDYLDDDDDGDGIPTKDEGADDDGNGLPDDARDTDNDNIPDYLDDDDDGDGIPTKDESSDADDNGVPDYLEPPSNEAEDDDGGVSNDGGCSGGRDCPDTGDGGVPEPPPGVDAGAGDGSVDAFKDSDGDGLLDVFECPGGDPCVDSDGDGIADYLDPDDDNDGIPTALENADPNGDGNPDDARDTDGDGIADYLDNDGDADMDGIPTLQEEPDPNGDGNFDDARDTDGDGTPDYLDADDDGDGVLTIWERRDINGDGIPDDIDTDGDGIPDHLDPDDDGDGVPTRLEFPDRNTDGNPSDARDTDGDGIPDYLDADDDGDGKPTKDELGRLDKPRDTDKDGIPDYLDPTDDRPRDDGVPDAASLEGGGGFGCAVTQPGVPSRAGVLTLLGVLLGVALWSRRRRRVVGAVVAASVLTAGVGSAQTISPGFSINRFNPSERGSDWFSGESLDLRGSGRVAIGIVGDWAYKPLVSYDQGGDEIAAVIENQVYAHAGVSVNLWDRLRLAASFPVLLYQSGTPVDFNGMRYATTEGVQAGDLRFGLDLRLFGEYGDAATLAIGSQVQLPTGDRAAYTSDDKVRVMPRIALAGDASILAYAVQVGLDARALRYDYAAQAFGTDLRFGASVGLRLANRKLLLGPELWGSTVLSDHGDGLFEPRTTPLEGVLGGHYFAGAWRFGLGVGPGFTRGFGSPALRVLGGIEWFPAIDAPAPPPKAPEDTDGDGILDPNDACPAVPGVASPDVSKHGCPVVRKDTDKDGIYDDEDACVEDAGVASDDPQKHGCPKDSDGDGILDRDDACIDVPGERNKDRSQNGCPPPKDSDGDGILDPEDVCPDKAGPPSDDPARHGCPRAQVEGERVIILDRIEFDTGKATIRPESEPILDAVRAVLDENPQIKKLRVEGHTDNRGGRVMNLGLSRRRAAAVVQWLVEHGIDAARLTSQGVGPDRPIDNNDTDSGRQNNRRVEFHIVEP